jgi:hypothetical protein
MLKRFESNARGGGGGRYHTSLKMNIWRHDTQSITTVSLATLSIAVKNRDTQHNDIQHNGTQFCCAECQKQVHYFECRYAQCRRAECRGAEHLWLQNQSMWTSTPAAFVTPIRGYRKHLQLRLRTSFVFSAKL